MCGIAGLAARNGTELEPALQRMATAMAHRGPDGTGIELVSSEKPAVGLCATRLAIQDTSRRGHQPMLTSGMTYCIAFNGELYNVADLRRELSPRYRFRGGSDTEVALAAWEAWGTSCLKRFRGMFAMAVWDARQRRLFLARDRVGIKPLYLQVRDDSLCFASELRALLASGAVDDPSLSPAGLESYLMTGSVAEPFTILEGIRAIPPGHWAAWDGATLTTEQYWSVTEAFADQPTVPTRAAAVARLRELLEDAVRRHLVSDVPLGVFLGGGIDATAITALLAAVTGEPPKTVSVVFPQRDYSEEPYVRTVVERFATEHYQLDLSPQALPERIPPALMAMDQPTVDGINTHIVSGASREAGLTVALSGVGGDELFAGYDTVRAVRRLNAVRRMIPAVARPAALALLSRRWGRGDRMDKLSDWLGTSASAESAYGVVRQLFGRSVVTNLLGASSQWRSPADCADVQPELDAVNSVSLAELSCYMRNTLLRDADVMSMSHSLEVRVPFLDSVLVDFVAALPGRWKTSREKPKPLLVDALGELLPNSIVHRPKMGFTLPFEHWLREEMRNEVESRLLDSDYGGQTGSALNHREIQRIWTSFLDRETSWSRPWALFVLKSWGERHL